MAWMKAARWRREAGLGRARLVVLLVLAAAGCHRGPEAAAPAAPAQHASASPDAGVEAPPTTSAPADAAPILWDGICADNPLAHGCM